ncbi:MAG: hypothetical protein ACR5K4_01275 [Sodalis sp. (in: enterobacteria)]
MNLSLTALTVTLNDVMIRDKKMPKRCLQDSAICPLNSESQQQWNQ